MVGGCAAPVLESPFWEAFAREHTHQIMWHVINDLYHLTCLWPYLACIIWQPANQMACTLGGARLGVVWCEIDHPALEFEIELARALEISR